jgi:crossover junction endodeoxyribonuclease RuvC
MVKDKVILGIDPGTNVMGFGVIHIQGRSVSLLEMGTLHMEKLDDHGSKLKMIFDCVLQLIDKHHPDEVAAEAPFFGKNVQSMLKLGRAQGVALAAALHRNIPIFEYSPRKIKQSITGKGAASKEQVSAMLQNLLKIADADMPKYFDATDGLAAAMCHYFQQGPAGIPEKNTLKKKSLAPVKKGEKKNVSGWQAFINQNPERVKK